MDKYAVVENTPEKQGSSDPLVICPVCATQLVREANVQLCPNCGTRPFESETPSVRP